MGVPSHSSRNIRSWISLTISRVTKLRGSTLNATQSLKNSSTRISRCPLRTRHKRFLSSSMRRASSAMEIPHSHRRSSSIFGAESANIAP